MSQKYLIIQTLMYLTRVDGKVHKLEKKFIQDRIKSFGFSDEEQIKLINEFNNPTSNYLETFRKLKKYSDRQSVLNFARHLFQLDGNLDSAEKKAFKELQAIEAQLSKEILQSSKLSAKAIVKEEDNLQFHKDVEDFVEVITKHRNLLFWHYASHFPFIIFYNLYNSGKYGRILAMFLLPFFVIMFVASLILFL